ncbi:MAG TPA: HAMP domain-containing sensor histidine kinase [Actinotalea sp.]|nr:HAMP domain-containing sensor histidine kinase [Actinotalea sp.]
MTSDPRAAVHGPGRPPLTAPTPAVRRAGLGPLGRRLVLAFSLVSLVAVALLALAAQQAVDRGLTASRAAGLWSLAEEAAQVAAQAHAAAGGWADADLTPTLAVAEEAGARATVRDAAGAVLAGEDAPGGGPGTGAQRAGGTSAEVVVDGVVVGSVQVGYQGAAQTGASARAEARGREVAWSWIVGAAVLALGLAVLAGWLVTRWLTGPLASLTDVARAFARGDAGARAVVHGTGELGDLARGFNEAADSVERSARARRQMAADVAHELRTPLTALQAGLEELRDGLAPADAESLSRLHDQSLRLGRVVEDLGVLAGADDAIPGTVAGRTDLARIVDAELAARAAELRAAGVTVGPVHLSPSTVLADTGRMHQVVGNLLANCARHCRPGDAVTVRLTRQGGEAVLAVADSGPGIAPADLPRVLDRYWRGPGARVPGSGLGLAVVREIVTEHHGSVEVTSDGGTTVTVRLPLADD